MHISLIVNSKLSLTHLNGYQLLVRLSIAHGSHFFRLYKQNKSSECKVILKGFLKLPNLYMPIKEKSLSLPRNLALENFGGLLIVF